MCVGLDCGDVRGDLLSWFGGRSEGRDDSVERLRFGVPPAILVLNVRWSERLLLRRWRHGPDEASPQIDH